MDNPFHSAPNISITQRGYSFTVGRQKWLGTRTPHRNPGLVSRDKVESQVLHWAHDWMRQLVLPSRKRLAGPTALFLDNFPIHFEQHTNFRVKTSLSFGHSLVFTQRPHANRRLAANLDFKYRAVLSCTSIYELRGNTQEA